MALNPHQTTPHPITHTPSPFIFSFFSTGEYGAQQLVGLPQSCTTDADGVTTCEADSSGASCEATSWRPTSRRGWPKCPSPTLAPTFGPTISGSHTYSPTPPAVVECVTVNMIDSYGDGWNAAYWTIATSGGVVEETGTLTTGTYGTYEHCSTTLASGECWLFALSSGTFDAEITFSLTYSDGTTILTGSGGSQTNTVCSPSPSAPSSAPTVLANTTCLDDCVDEYAADGSLGADGYCDEYFDVAFGKLEGDRQPPAPQERSHHIRPASYI